jgi:ribose-phosphate pyrophosphokinase
MGKQNRQEILHAGGIAIVSTPNMEYMARVAYNELRRRIRKRSIDFHVMRYQSFSRGEVLPQVTKNVRLKSVYLFYDFNGDACHDAFVLQLTISALQDAGADSITLMMPFMPFLRQDRKDRSRVPISAKDFIDGYERYEKVERTVTLDMHAAQTQMGFTKRSDHLPGFVIFVPWIEKHFGNRLNNLVIVGPDAGSEKRVTQIARRIGCKRAFLTKERDGSKVEMHEIHGASVEGMTCLLNDDIMDSCKTIIKAAEALKDQGAAEVVLTATHPVFGEEGGTTAYQKLAASGLRVVVTDSLKTKKHDWLEVLPLGKYMGHAILANNIADGSVSKIIEEGVPT